MQLQSDDYFEHLNEGIIYIDPQGKIIQHNQRAANILGVTRSCPSAHQAGCIEPGDIVIAVVTSVGDEHSHDIETYFDNLGIGVKNLANGSTVIFAGIYGDTTKRGLIKVKSPKVVFDSLTMDKAVSGLPFKASVDYLERRIAIEVLGQSFCVRYKDHFNHVVVVNCMCNAVKFYQMQGYSAWREELKMLLEQKPYSAKRVGLNSFDIVGQPIDNIIRHGSVIENLLACAGGQQIDYTRQYGAINGISVNASVIAVRRDDRVTGALLLFSDISKLKTIENQKLRVNHKLERANAMLDNQALYDKLFPTIIGASTKTRELKQLAAKACNSKSNVLILGESGTGKSVLARAIHTASKYADTPFVQVNCSSIPESLIESELFGYEKGAFTGASKSGRKGYFELANSGTIFLDEIGDIPLSMQTKLLHVIQNRRFYRIGGTDEIDIDVRVIVATNKDLRQAVTEGNFREDLYYRINVFPIMMPPLRERMEDIYALISYQLPKICNKVDVARKRLSSEAMNKLLRYAWPGNIRELENVLERAVNLAETGVIDKNHIVIKDNEQVTEQPVNYIRPLRDILADTEREAIESVMQMTGGDKREAMKILKMKKTNFYDKIKQFRESEITEKKSTNIKNG